MSTSNFPPDELRKVVEEVATLLKERKETISVAETVCNDRVLSSPC
jgi:nicotinamide mononucleotide (NMN) deamidase PncC